MKKILLALWIVAGPSATAFAAAETNPGCLDASCLAAIESRELHSSRPCDAGPSPTNKRWLHGFRIGTVRILNHDRPLQGDDPESSLRNQYDLRSPWMFAIGYEGMRRIVGHSWLNVILVANATVVGLEQSKFIPTGNALVGFEFDQSFQVGVGANLSPEKGKPLHMIAAAGWTPKVGSFYIPVHLTVVPDVDGNHRIGSTVGVNW